MTGVVEDMSFGRIERFIEMYLTGSYPTPDISITSNPDFSEHVSSVSFTTTSECPFVYDKSLSWFLELLRTKASSHVTSGWGTDNTRISEEAFHCWKFTRLAIIKNFKNGEWPTVIPTYQNEIVQW